MMDQFNLYLIEQDPDKASNLTRELKAFPTIRVFVSYTDALSASHGFDAMFVSLMSAIEWGTIRVPAPLHTTKVVKTPAYEVAKGRPQYAIPGVATSPGEQLTPAQATRLVLSESFKAIRLFNRANPTPLRCIGAAASSLGFNRLAAGEAAEILRLAYMSAAA